MDLKFVKKFPTPAEYNMLTDAVGWGTREESIIEEALRHTLYILYAFMMEKSLLDMEESLVIRLSSYTYIA